MKTAMSKALIPAAMALMLASPALAGAPEPRQAIELKRLAGQWHEIARTPNFRQKDCKAGTTRWEIGAPDRIRVDTVCIRANGGAKTVKARAEVVDRQRNAKVKMTFLSGLISQEYWLLDRAPDYRWLIMGTPGGNYIWIFSRDARPGAGVRAEAIARARRLGYNVSNLVQSE
jgi:apolipoprotein D and lipocalin family protein